MQPWTGEPLFEPTSGFREWLKQLYTTCTANAAQVEKVVDAAQARELRLIEDLAATKATFLAVTRETASQVTTALTAVRGEVDELKAALKNRDERIAHLEDLCRALSTTTAQHSKQLSSQTDWNAIRSAELATVADKLAALSTAVRAVPPPSKDMAVMSRASSVHSAEPFAIKPAAPLHHAAAVLERSVELPSSLFTPQRSIAAPTPPLGATPHDGIAERFATVGELAETRRRIDDWMMLFGINAMQVQAACSRTQAERVRLIHSAPAFHAFWTELFQLNSRLNELEILNNDNAAPSPATPSRRTAAVKKVNPVAVGDDSAARASFSSPAQYESRRPNNALVAGDVRFGHPYDANPPAPQRRHGDGFGLLDHTPRSHDAARPIATGGGSTIFIPALGADVGPRDYLPSRANDRHPGDAPVGVMVHRVVSGSLLAKGGVAPGDTILALNGETIVDGTHLAVLAESLPPEVPPQISVLPHARATAVPLAVTLDRLSD